MAQQKINDQMPVETIDGAEVRITVRYSQTGNLTGWIIRDDRKYLCNWTLDGTPTTGGEPNNAIRNKAARQKIDRDQPVETITGGEAVITGTNDEHGTLVGFVVENDRKHSMMWNKFGQPLCGGDMRRAIRNKAAPVEIDHTKPIETVAGLEAYISTHYKDSGNLSGWIVTDNGKLNVSWNAFGKPLGYDRPDSLAIINKAPKPAPIDITKPVRLKNDPGNPVTSLHTDDSKWIYGYCNIDGDTKPLHWHLDGRAEGWSEAVGPIENVPDPEPIRTLGPVETVQGCKVHLDSFGVGDGSLTGTVVMSNGSLVRMSWDRFGNVTAKGYSEVWNIRNRPPQPTPEQIEAEAIEQFYAALEEKLGEDYTDRTYEDAVVSGDFGFVRDQQMDGMWEAWAIPDAEGCTTQLAHGLPAYIGRDHIAEFYEWFDARLDRAADAAYERGNAAGRKEAAAYIKRAHTAYLTAMNGIGDFFEKDEYIPF